MGIVIAKQVAEETAVVCGVSIDGCGDAVRVDTVTVCLLVLSMSWVVDHESV
jgi:hypothetical protein